MSTFNAIKELRQAGHLTDAHQQASEWLVSDSKNIWAKRALAWVVYDLTKQEVAKGNWEKVLSHLDELNSLELGAGEEMIFDKLCFQIGKMIFAILRTNGSNVEHVSTIVRKIQSFPMTKPSEAYSFLLKAMHKGLKDSPGYAAAIDWWGLENLGAEDFKEQEYNGRRMMSIGEQVIIAKAKTLLEGEQNGENPFEARGINKEAVDKFLPFLTKVIETHSDLKYPSYYKGKLLMALGSTDEALKAFLPFAQKNRSQFWVWDLLGDFYKSNPDNAIAAYTKALLCKSPPEFVIKVREKLAALLIENSNYEEAKYEIQKIVQIREGEGWRLSRALSNWQQSPWYAEVKVEKDNYRFYKSKASHATRLLYPSLVPEIAVIEFVNHNKRVANWMVSKTKRGFFNYSSTLNNPKIGDTVNLYLVPGSRNQKFEVADAEPINVKTDLVKTFSGAFKGNSSGKFGFVEGVFIAGDCMANWRDGDRLKGKAILSYNNKRKEWGWKAFYVGKAA